MKRGELNAKIQMLAIEDVAIIPIYQQEDVSCMKELKGLRMGSYQSPLLNAATLNNIRSAAVEQVKGVDKGAPLSRLSLRLRPSVEIPDLTCHVKATCFHVKCLQTIFGN